MKINRIRIYKKPLPYIGGAYVKMGKLYASDAPGLGVEPDFDHLGAPVFDRSLDAAER